MNDAAPSAPKHHPDCCFAISQRLLASLSQVLPPKPSLTLSIGSGTGYLEAALLRFTRDSLDIRGVEVAAHVNKYLPKENIVCVGGTWDLYSGAADADVWMLSYPREPGLLSRYIERFGDAKVRKIIWLGPKQDWEDYEAVLASWSSHEVTVLKECGSASYEMMAIASKEGW